MSLTTFLYSLKVWLSAVFAAPVLLFIGTCFKMDLGHIDISKMLAADSDMYQTLIMFGGIFSFPTWLIFLLAIMILMKCTDSPKRKKLSIAISAVILTIATFAAFFRLLELTTDQSVLYFLLSYSVCIAAGCLYYKLEATEAPNPEISMTEQ